MSSRSLQRARECRTPAPASTPRPRACPCGRAESSTTCELQRLWSARPAESKHHQDVTSKLLFFCRYKRTYKVQQDVCYREICEPALPRRSQSRFRHIKYYLLILHLFFVTFLFFKKRKKVQDNWCNCCLKFSQQPEEQAGNNKGLFLRQEKKIFHGKNLQTWNLFIFFFFSRAPWHWMVAIIAVMWQLHFWC